LPDSINTAAAAMDRVRRRDLDLMLLDLGLPIAMGSRPCELRAARISCH
jgi:DNA-binding response OmpR family regulator